LIYVKLFLSILEEEIMNQVHDKFKVFTGGLSEDGTISRLAGEVEKFVSESKITPKSIGAEYLEKAGRLILTLGYRDDEQPTPIKINCVPIGKVDISADFSNIESAMMKAAASQRNIICHELFITDNGDFFMVFMIQI
jgi:hypothetical protein